MAVSSKVAALVVRLVLGSILLAHGLLMLGLLRGGEAEVAAAIAAGNQHGFGEIYRIASMVILTAGGVMLVLGLGSRFAALAALALMVHRVVFVSQPYFFAADGGFEAPLALAALALSVLLTGSGILSLDAKMAGRKEKSKDPGGPVETSPQPSVPTGMPMSE